MNIEQNSKESKMSAPPQCDSFWVWESARATMQIRKEQERLLVIDEVQKIDNWSEVVKGEWDEDSRRRVNLKVVLLGSSRLL